MTTSSATPELASIASYGKPGTLLIRVQLIGTQNR